MKIVHTMASEARTKVPEWRFYSPELKLEVIEECCQTGASIAGVALKHGVNANIVHRWLREHSQGTLAVQPLSIIPVTLTAPPTSQQSELRHPPDIRIQVQQIYTTIFVNLPVQDAATCAQWLREWLA